MKREGWQHGMVRSTTKATTTTTTSAIGLAFAKAPSKPTGNSKYTGKCKKARCTQCHSHPVSKSRDKAKGTYKLKSSDVVLNHRLVSWRVVGDRNVHWSKYSGVSASGVLDALLTDSCWSQGDDEDHEEQEYGYGDGFGDINQEEDDEGIEEQGYGDGFGDINQEEDDEGIEEQGYGDDDDMGFCEVGFVLDCMDEEGWCVVDEM